MERTLTPKRSIVEMLDAEAMIQEHGAALQRIPRYQDVHQDAFGIKVSGKEVVGYDDLTTIQKIREDARKHGDVLAVVHRDVLLAITKETKNLLFLKVYKNNRVECDREKIKFHLELENMMIFIAFIITLLVGMRFINIDNFIPELVYLTIVCLTICMSIHAIFIPYIAKIMVSNYFKNNNNLNVTNKAYYIMKIISKNPVKINSNVDHVYYIINKNSFRVIPEYRKVENTIFINSMECIYTGASMLFESVPKTDWCIMRNDWNGVPEEEKKIKKIIVDTYMKLIYGNNYAN